MKVFASPAHRLHHPLEAHLFAGEALAPREVPARAEAILAELGVHGGFEVHQPPSVDRDALLAVHSADYLAFLETAHPRWCARTGRTDGEAMPFVRPYVGHTFADPDDVLAQLGRFSHDADPVLAGTWEAALASASCAVAAAEVALAGAGATYALCRPPGHHAASESFGGYCYLNNGAIVAQRIVGQGGRVAILDVDAHAGNGAQSIFWTSPDVQCISIHSDPAHEYPYFAGYAHETGGGAGEGFTLNLPLSAGTDWSGYRVALAAACGRLEAFAPDLVVVALGVDTAVEDGVLALRGDDYRRLGECIRDLDRPTVLIQEGGYDLSVLGANVVAVLDGVGA